MRVARVEDLEIWRRARHYMQAVFAITQLAPFARDLRLREQLNDCCDSVLSNVAEGFGQSTDRAFARYLAISRASLLESRSHLIVAVDRKYVSAQVVAPQLEESLALERMTLALIRHLHRSNRRNRI